MSDDLERRLDDFYRSFDGPARRSRAEWMRTADRPRFRPAWIAAAAAALLFAGALALGTRRPPTTPPPDGSPALAERPPAPAPAPATAAPPARHDPNRLDRDRPPTAAPTSEPRSGLAAPPSLPPAPVQRSNPLESLQPPVASPPPAPTSPAPPAPAAPDVKPAPTRTEIAGVVFPAVEGTFSVGETAFRTPQKDLKVDPRDALSATSIVKITLGEDRSVLLAPKSRASFRPEADGLEVRLDHGELLADLGRAGPALAVSTSAFRAAAPSGAWSVRIQRGGAAVLVERGTVEVANARGKASVRAGQAVAAADGAAPSAPAPADLRGHAWARPQRAPEATVFDEDFSKPRAWLADVDKGVAKGRPQPGTCAARLQLESVKPPLFEVPVKGRVTLVCQTDRASRMYVQLFVPEVGANFRREVALPRGSAWRTVVMDLDEFRATDPSKHPGRPPAGAAVTDVSILYGVDEDRGSFWVDSFRVTEIRP